MFMLSGLPITDTTDLSGEISNITLQSGTEINLSTVVSAEQGTQPHAYQFFGMWQFKDQGPAAVQKWGMVEIKAIRQVKSVCRYSGNRTKVSTLKLHYLC